MDNMANNHSRVVRPSVTGRAAPTTTRRRNRSRVRRTRREAPLRLAPAGAQQRGLDQLAPVREPDDEHVAERADAVHLREQLVDDLAE